MQVYTGIFKFQKKQETEALHICNCEDLKITDIQVHFDQTRPSVIKPNISGRKLLKHLRTSLCFIFLIGISE